MSHCVPSWELLQDSSLPFVVSRHKPSFDDHLLMADTEAVAELRWQNGQLALHGLSHPGIAKPVPKHPPTSAAWEKQGPSGTLESIIDQATRSHLLALNPSLWPASATADAIVPCTDVDRVPYSLPQMKRPRHAEAGRICPSQGSCAPTAGKGESTIVTLDNTWVDDVGFTTNSASPDDFGFTTTSASPEGGASPDTENTSFGGGRPATTIDDHDSFCHSRDSRQRDAIGEDDDKLSKGETGRSAVCMKRRRASAIHNQSERKRRDKINERMKALQKMVPNSSKTDKASMLDEVIEYLKTLQAQVQMMSRMSSMSHMMMPMPMAAMAQYQMSMMANMAQMSQMGMGMGMMDINPLAQAGHPGMPPMLHPSTSLHHLAGGPWGAANDRMPQPAAAAAADPFSAFLPGTTQQPMGMDAFNRMTAMYHQLYQQAPPAIPKP